jgi:hypothetical protein
VEQLINHKDRSWKEDLVNQIFMPHDVVEILKIRLSRFEEDDFIYWTPEKHGMFTMKSAYNLSLDLRSNNPPNTSGNLDGDMTLWNTIWKSNVPPKVKKSHGN